MTVEILKSKLHRIPVTEARLDYEGSLTLDPDDMEAAGIFSYEKILVANVENGERFETYAIPGKRGSRVCCLNGAAARRVQPGDVVIIMSYALLTPDEAATFKPRVIFPDTATNRLIEA